MKVKITLRFRGRKMAPKEIGFLQLEKFVKSLAPYGYPDAPPKLIGKGINVTLSPLPRAKRAKNPRQAERDIELAAERAAGPSSDDGEGDEALPEHENGLPAEDQAHDSAPPADQADHNGTANGEATP